MAIVKTCFNCRDLPRERAPIDNGKTAAVATPTPASIVNQVFWRRKLVASASAAAGRLPGSKRRLLDERIAKHLNSRYVLLCRLEIRIQYDDTALPVALSDDAETRCDLRMHLGLTLSHSFFRRWCAEERAAAGYRQ